MSSSGAATANFRPGPAEFALLAAISLAWGTSYILTKIAVTSLPPLTLIAARTLIASAAMVALAGSQGGIRLKAADLPVIAVVGLASGAVPLALIAVSVSYVNASTTATAMALVPILAAAYGVLWGQYPTPRQGLGLLLGFTGIIVLFGPGALMALGDSARGAAAALSAALVFAGSLHMARRVRGIDSLTVATVSQVVSAVAATAVALAVDGVPRALPPSGVVAAVVVLGIANTALANLLLFALLARANAGFTALNNYLVPAVAVTSGTLVLGEPMTAASLGGTALILAGVAVSTMPRAAPARGTG
ncbi:DMT family transporter [Alsobacter sp. R-9]